MKILSILSILLLGGFAIVGCANIPSTYAQCYDTHFATPMEAEICLQNAAKYKQEQYDKADRRLVRRDKLIVFLNACDAIPYLVVVEIRHTGRSLLPTSRKQRVARREYGYPYTHDNVHRNARLYDFKCVNPRDIRWDLYNVKDYGE